MWPAHLRFRALCGAWQREGSLPGFRLFGELPHEVVIHRVVAFLVVISILKMLTFPCLVRAAFWLLEPAAQVEQHRKNYMSLSPDPTLSSLAEKS